MHIHRRARNIGADSGIVVGAKDGGKPVEIVPGRVEKIVAERRDAVAQRFHRQQQAAQVQQALSDRVVHQ
ncbi:hypothetical protein D9M70_483330 [compost metagenome]